MRSLGTFNVITQQSGAGGAGQGGGGGGAGWEGMVAGRKTQEH